MINDSMKYLVLVTVYAVGIGPAISMTVLEFNTKIDAETVAEVINSESHVQYYRRYAEVFAKG